MHPIQAVRGPRLSDAHCWSLGAPRPGAPPACVEQGAPRAPCSGQPCHSWLHQEGLLWAHHEGRGFLPGSQAGEPSCLFRPAKSGACLALRRCLSAVPRLNPSLCPPHTEAPLRFLPLASRVSFNKSSVSRDRQSHYCNNRRQSAGEIQAFIPTLKFSLEVGEPDLFSERPLFLPEPLCLHVVLALPGETTRAWLLQPISVGMLTWDRVMASGSPRSSFRESGHQLRRLLGNGQLTGAPLPGALQPPSSAVTPPPSARHRAASSPDFLWL